MEQLAPIAIFLFVLFLLLAIIANRLAGGEAGSVKEG